MSQGLSQPYIYSILQDQKGYLWLGTADGLSAFNGLSFRTYSTADSLTDKFVTAGIVDGTAMWFGHRNGRITYFDGKKFHHVPSDGTKSGSVTHFSRSPGGEIWGSTLSGWIFKLRNGKIIPGGILLKENRQILSFEFITDNQILAGTDMGLLLLRLNDDGVTGIEEIKEFQGVKVPVVFKMRHGSALFAADENGELVKLYAEDSSLKIEKIHPSGTVVLPEIQSICDDSEGNIWVATFGKGLVKIPHTGKQSGPVTYFNAATGFITDNVRVVFEDREGNIWAGNYGDGLTMLMRKLFDLNRYDRSKPDNNVFSVETSETCRWIGTGYGLLKVNTITGKVIKNIGPESGLPSDTVTALLLSGKKELWIGTFKNGLFRKDTGNGGVRRFSLSTGILENSITSLSGSNGIVWAGTKKGLYRIDTGTGLTEYYSISHGGLPHNSVSCLYSDRNGKLWITTKSSILSYLENGKINKIPLGSGEGLFTLGPVNEDASGRIWVGSEGSGVFLIEEDSILCLTTREGLLSNYCYSLSCDRNQNIWIGHLNGISRIRTPDFSVKQIAELDNLTGDFKVYQNSSAIENSGKILFGTDKGLITYDPSFEYTENVPPIIGITSIRVNDEEKTMDGNRLYLPPGIYKIRIDYFGVSLREPELVKYQHKLENFDDWSDVTNERFIVYPRISFGEYKFILKASSGDGSVTEDPLVFSIIIKTPVTRKWWFWIFCVIILALIVFAYIKWRIQKLISEKRILEEKIEERTQEIRNQKNKIELQRDEIEQINNSITSSITYASKIQSATLPPIELIETLLPESFIFHRPKDIVSGDFYWVSEKDDKIIVAVADCTGHGVPGAFMSLLGITFLNEIVNLQGITDSREILTVLKARVIQALMQNRKDSITSDGMDMALCVIDRQKGTVQFTGAMNDLIYISRGKRFVIKADKMDVSPADWNAGEFTSNTFEYTKGDMIYLFSDGYQDQFGGDFDKKFLKPHFYNILFEMSGLSVKGQKEFLRTKLKDWMKEHSQTDDITVLGIRL